MNRDSDPEQWFRWVPKEGPPFCSDCKTSRHNMFYACEHGHYMCAACLRMRARDGGIRHDGENRWAKPDKWICREFVCRACDDRTK